MSVCRHELGGGANPQPPPDNSNPGPTGVHVEHVVLRHSLDDGPEELNAEAEGALDAAEDTAAVPDDQLKDNEADNELGPVVDEQTLGERLRQPALVFL